MSNPIVVVRDGQSNSGGVTGRKSFIDSDRLNGEQIFQMSWGIQDTSTVPVPPMGQFYQMEFPTQMVGMSGLTGCSFTMNFCKKLAAANPGRPIYLICCDVPGTGYNWGNPYYTWGHDGFTSYADIPDSLQTKYLTKQLVDTVKTYSPTGTFDYLVGIQGENDQKNTNYQSDIMNRISYLRSIFGQDFIFAMGTMLPSWLRLAAPAISDTSHRMLGHSCHRATTSFHDHINGAFDGVHFNSESQRQIGIEFWNNINRNIHAYDDPIWNRLFDKNSLFWYDFSRQNSNYGYMGPESKAFWDRTTDTWNENTTGVKVGSHDCLWANNDHVNTGNNASGATNYTKIVMFTPYAINYGNLMSGSMNSVLWVRGGSIEAMIGGRIYTVPKELMQLVTGRKYTCVLSVSPEQVIIKVDQSVSVTIPVGNSKHQFNYIDNQTPIHIGNIPKSNDINDGSDWYGFNGEIHFAGMLNRNLNSWDCGQAIDYISKYWN